MLGQAARSSQKVISASPKMVALQEIRGRDSQTRPQTCEVQGVQGHSRAGQESRAWREPTGKAHDQPGMLHRLINISCPPTEYLREGATFCHSVTHGHCLACCRDSHRSVVIPSTADLTLHERFREAGISLKATPNSMFRVGIRPQVCLSPVQTL